jgi:hypothetical protein
MQPIRLSRYAPFMRRTLRLVVAPLLLTMACSGVALAQRNFGGFFREGSLPARYAPRHMPDGSFVICRLQYSSVRREESGIGWLTDYPFSEIHLTTRLAEITKTRVSRDSEGTPNYYVVRPTDDELFNCPILVASDVGTMGLETKEITRLREYFLKGGFLWVDDFWGDAAWDQWSEEIQQVLPPPDFRIEDLPLSHPLFHAMFEVSKLPQITNIMFWRRNGGYTSERGEESKDVHFRVIKDKHDRIMMVMTHNTDMGDSFEREGEDPEFFAQFSPAGYALGLDILLHAMSH